MIVPDHVSLNMARDLLGRREETVEAWCEELGISFKRIGNYGRYMTQADYHRLAMHANASYDRPKGYLSINAVDARLRRHPRTVRRWCAEMGIEISRRPYHGLMAEYILATDYNRLKEYHLTQPHRRPPQQSRKQIACADDCERNSKARAIRDAELRRRITAASRWKVRHCGAEVWEEAIQAELAAMSAFPTL